MKKHVLLVIPLMLGATLAFSQPIAKIFGTEDSLTVKQQVNQYLRYLDVQEAGYILVQFTDKLPEKLEGITYDLSASIFNNDPVIEVRIKASLSKRKQRLVLAHEMVHVRQYVKGELQVINKYWALWKGRKYYCNPDNRYSPPWEREAYRMDRLVAEAGEKQTTEPLMASRADQ